MFENVLQQMRRGIRAGQLILTTHAYDEMNADDLFVDDLEHCIRTGLIMTRQWDDDFGEWKYVIHGDCRAIVRTATKSPWSLNWMTIVASSSSPHFAYENRST